MAQASLDPSIDYLSVSLFVSFFLYLSLSLSATLPLFVSFSATLPLFVSFSLSLSLSLFLLLLKHFFSSIQVAIAVTQREARLPFPSTCTQVRTNSCMKIFLIGIATHNVVIVIDLNFSPKVFELRKQNIISMNSFLFPKATIAFSFSTISNYFYRFKYTNRVELKQNIVK